MKLIDTNILIDAVDESSPNLERAQDVLNYYLGAGEAVVSLQSISELYYALTKRNSTKDAREAADKILDSNSFKKISPDVAAYSLALSMAEEHGLRRGKFFDALLAATAKRNGINTILTENKYHFEKFGMNVETLETAKLSERF